MIAHTCACSFFSRQRAIKSKTINCLGPIRQLIGVTDTLGHARGAVNRNKHDATATVTPSVKAAFAQSANNKSLFLAAQSIFPNSGAIRQRTAASSDQLIISLRVAANEGHVTRNQVKVFNKLTSRRFAIAKLNLQ